MARRGRVVGVASSYSRRTTVGPGIVGNMILEIEKQPTQSSVKEFGRVGQFPVVFYLHLMLDTLVLRE